MTMPCGLALALLAVVRAASPGPIVTGTPAPISSASPARAPSASPTPSDVARWVSGLGTVRFGAFALSRAMNDFAGDEAGRFPPTIGVGNAGKTIDICFEPYRSTTGCGYHVIVAARDVPSPPSAVARAPESRGSRAAPLGLTYPQLLARFHADEDFAAKNVVRDRAGSVAFISALDEDPPPSRYDHGPQAYVRQEYFFRDGVVAAYAYRETMN